VGDDVHGERIGAARNLLADPAEADETERLVLHLFAEKLLLLPLALLHRRVCGRDVAGERQHVAHRQLGDADAVRSRRVHHDDAAGAGGGDVDVIHTRARPRDRAQVRSGLDQGRSDLRRTADHDGVGIRQVGGELVR
jgi:hypothetical protein